MRFNGHHEVTVTQVAEVEWQAHCDCGWSGDPMRESQGLTASYWAFWLWLQHYEVST